MEALNGLNLPSNGMRIVVQRTFFEVVEEGGSKALETAGRRAFSAPVAPRKIDEPPSGKEGAEAECPDSPLDMAWRGQEAEHELGQEPKTTVALRSIPLHFARDQIMQQLDARGFAGQYDFLYLPIDFSRRQNFGYSFVNLTSHERAQRIIAEFDGIDWGQPGEGKAVVSWSLTQGLDLHIERYRNSPVMHESMLDECKPIVLEGGVRVDFPPPTKKVQRLRRLRTRCGSRGRGVSGEIPGMEAQQIGDALGTPADSCMLLPGLSSAQGGADQEADPILASRLLAGLVPAAPGPQESEALGARSTTATASHSKKPAWADLQDDCDDGRSECSTQAPCYSSGALSSDGSGLSSDGLAARRRGSDSPIQLWSGSVLARGLMPVLPEEAGAQPSIGVPTRGSLIEVVGTYPSGAHAVITGVDREEGTYKIQMMHNGCRTRRLMTIRGEHARLLRHAEAGQ